MLIGPAPPGVEETALPDVRRVGPPLSRLLSLPHAAEGRLARSVRTLLNRHVPNKPDPFVAIEPPWV